MTDGMAQRKVFGKRTNTKQDAFASMLKSSPDVVKPSSQAIVGKPDTSAQDDAGLRRSPRRQKAHILQPVNGNIVVAPRDKIAAVVSQCKKRPAVRKSMILDDTPKRSSTSAQTFENLNHDPREEISSHISPQVTEHKGRDARIYTEHCRTLLEMSSSPIESFSAWATRLSEHLNVSKIAEASYGEVYRLSLRPGPDTENSMLHHESVLKIIPLKPPKASIPTTKRERSRVIKKISMMSEPDDVLSEVRLLQRMSMIPGYTDFREMTVLQGRPPSIFVKAYRAYNKTQEASGKDLSTYPDPAKKTAYDEDQLWAVIEMKDAGTDLEQLVEQGLCNDIWSIWDIFWQVTLALAKGEDAAEFEHRDLHLGNICIQRRDRTHTSKKLHFTNLDLTIIDYTVSRATMADTQDIAYIDLAKDQWLFTADSTYEYQYDIYRYMRSVLFHDDPLAVFDNTESTRAWSQHHPQTNLVWLHYLVYTLLEQMQDEVPPSKASMRAKQHISRWRHSRKLNKVMLKVNDLLHPECMIHNGITSASMLVATALENGWLDEQDVIGEEDSVSVDDLISGFEKLQA